MTETDTISKYKPEYCRQAYVASAGGFDRAHLGKLFDVSKDEIDDWLREYPEFAKAVLRGMDEYDTTQIEGALKKIALGYEYDEVTEKFDEDGDLVGRKIVTKQVQPSIQAITLWLTNRNRLRWSNRQDVAVTGGVKIVVEKTYGQNAEQSAARIERFGNN